MIEEPVVAAAHLVDETRGEDPHVVDDQLMRMSVDLGAVEHQPADILRFTGPTVAAVPRRFLTFDEIDARRVLILVGMVLIHREVVVGKTRRRLIRRRVIFQERDRRRADATGRDDVPWEWRAREGILQHRADLREIAIPHRD